MANNQTCQVSAPHNHAITTSNPATRHKSQELCHQLSRVMKRG